MATSYTKCTKPTTSFTKEPKHTSKGGFDFGKFDESEFDQIALTVFTKTSKPTTSFTKETKP